MLQQQNLQLLFILIFSLIVSNQSLAQCNTADWTALKALYESTGGDNWIYRTGWDLVISEQNLPPQDCDLTSLSGLQLSENGRVVGLHLYNNNLAGTIPVEIEKLSQLTVLDLGFNNLTGSLPSELGKLNNLKKIWLDGNQLNGKIPTELGALSLLSYLNLSENNLNGNIPPSFGNLVSLTILYLHQNQLTGKIPIELSNILNLEELRLDDNLLSENIPSRLGNLNSLKILYLYNNQLTGNIPSEFGNLNNIDILSVWGNQLTGCYHQNLSKLCTQLNETFNDDRYISYENNFDISWESFCKYGADYCSVSKCDLDDWTALKALYESAGGTNWTNQFGWEQVMGEATAENCNLENIYGVDLNENGRISVLNLTANNLTGNIPSGLGELIEISYLSLAENNLSGNIPSSLGKLDSLTILYLFDNQLTGEIPETLGTLNKLKDLGLDRNQLSGGIPSELGNMASLSALNLWDNQLSGNIPPELGKLNQLTNLSFYKNKLSGNIPTEIKNLKQLAYLDFGANFLNGIIPLEIGNLTNLKELWLEENQLSGNIPSEIGDLVNLRILNIWGNQLSGCYPENLIKLCNQLNEDYNKNGFISYSNNFDTTWEFFCEEGVEHCSIPKCNLEEWTALKALYENAGGVNWTNQFGWDQVKGNTPPENCNLENLHGVFLNKNGRISAINLTANNLTGNIPSGLGELIEISYLSLAENNLSGNIPSNLGKLNGLTVLYLYDNQLTGPLPKELGKLNNLVDLGLDRNKLNGVIPPELGDMKSLEAFNLWGNQLTGSIPSEIGKLSNLKVLGLKENQLTGKIPDELGNLSELIKLDLYNNQLTDEIPVSLAQLSNLKYLILWQNQLSGEIPLELGQLNNLILLYLAHNKLTGNIPKELGNLKNVIDLGLDSNGLTGEIPSELGDMESLEALSLWENKLAGSIPKTLGNLSKMKYLRLYANQLKGGIPSELGKLLDMQELVLSNNKLEGDIPDSLGLLSNLEVFTASQNRLTGHIPSSFNNLTQLKWFDVSKNHLRGLIPEDLGREKDLYADVRFNYFECNEIKSFQSKINEGDTYLNSPQCYENENIEERIIIDSLTLISDTSLVLTAPFIISDGVFYQWFQNDNLLQGETNVSLVLKNITPKAAGKYKLAVVNSCDGVTYFSDPIYVIIEGYDLNGQPVERNQIMVEFDNKDEMKRFKLELEDEEIFITRKDSCNCNRELYLWEFGSAEATSIALLNIDKKRKLLKKKSNVSGGFNNLINIGEQKKENKAFHILTDTLNSKYENPVSIYLIDSGLDEENYDAREYLKKSAPIESCYTNVKPSQGYNFTDTDSLITNNYKDDLWHGTFGFRSIADKLPAKSNIKIVPLKVFNSKGEGSLFKLVCALYHAIDHNADVINLSAGYQGQASDVLENAINAARQKGIFIVAAAGNEGIDMDEKNAIPQFPAYYASKYHYFFDSESDYTFDTISVTQQNSNGDTLTVYKSRLDSIPILKSVRYDNVISVASINKNGLLSEFSNHGKESTTLAAYGENLHSYALKGSDAVASGTSMATYLVTRELALEIASDTNRTYQKILTDFEKNRMVNKESLTNVTRTGKQLKVQLEEATILGCTDPNACNYYEFANQDDGTCEFTYCPCNQADWFALKKLYESTNGDNWKNKDNWDVVTFENIPTNCNLQTLHGVKLNELGRVSGINLYNNNLSGYIPVEIEKLSELEGLYLAANNLAGNIPHQLGSLTNLKNLILSANQLIGSIPFQLSNLNNLERLYLSYNQLTGTISLSFHNLNKLKYLLLDNNSLIGNMPADLTLLNQLYLLTVNDNQLGGCYVDTLKSLCSQLQYSQFKGNARISAGNNFDASWEDFCISNKGFCIENRNTQATVDDIINVFPNPSEGYMIVKLLESEKYEGLSILNILGEKLLQIDVKKPDSNVFEFDLNQFPKGMYFVEVSTARNKFMQKFVLK